MTTSTESGVQYFFNKNTNLFSILDEVDIIAHGCNTMGIMGAGIALQMRLRYPAMYTAYQKLCSDNSFSDTLCGRIQVWDKDTPIVCNLFTQHHLGRHAKLDYINQSFFAMFSYMRAFNLTKVAIPLVGCGIGGLKFNNVFPEIVDAARFSRFGGTIRICIPDDSDPFT
jgi:O-acetyl-ADP-ribose deacetylase (regulator of RNase III)